MKRVLVGVFLAAVVLAGCGGDGGGSNQDLIDAFIAQGAPADEAKCVAEKLDGVSVQDVAGFADATEPGDIDPGVLAKIAAAATACGLAG